jgi:LuxR family maltose regulon positive regulatory protein
LLHGLAAHAEQRGQLRAALEAFVLLAIAQHAVGDERGALAILERALLLAEPDGYVRTFLDAGPAILIMLEVGLGRSEWGRGNGDHRGVRSYARTLLEHLPRRHAPAVPSTPAAVNLPPGVEPLTVRELDVLRLIATGKSNGEIAETLVVAVSTVKAHINNIFGKLGVTSRTQALARARDFQLL